MSSAKMASILLGLNVLKEQKNENSFRKTFINEDMTTIRLYLCFEARKLKPYILHDVWTRDGRALGKDARILFHLIRNIRDLQNFNNLACIVWFVTKSALHLRW